MIYKLYTEDKNRDKIIEIVSNYFDGFTVYPATGLYKGQKEASLVIEIAVKAAAYDAEQSVWFIIKKIKQANNQESVGLVVTKDEMRLEWKCGWAYETDYKVYSRHGKSFLRFTNKDADADYYRRKA